MPFSETNSLAEEKWTEIFEHIIKPAVEESGLGYECKRYGLGRANIVKDILEDLNRAQVVLADLTDDSSNVLWELGVRHTLKRRTLLISQDTKFIPSDLKDYPVIPYDQTKAGFDKFKENIRKKLEDIEADPDKPDSPVADFLGLKNIDILAYEKAANLKKLDALLSELSFDIENVDNISKGLREHGLSDFRLQNVCMRLFLSTRYINPTAEILADTSLCDRMVDWVNQQLGLIHQSIMIDNEGLAKQLAEGILPMKNNFASLFIKIVKVRTDFANDNYQEPKEPIILLASSKHEQYLKLTE